MAEPTTYAGYKVGTIVAMIMGTGVTTGLANGPLLFRVFAGVAGGCTTWVATPLIAPIVLKLFTWAYGWFEIPPDQLPQDSVIGVTGFGVALIGVDLCRQLIETSKKVMKKFSLSWISRPKT